MSKSTDKRFDIVISATVAYTLTENDLRFLNEGQAIQVIVDNECDLIIQPPKPQENK